MAIHVKVVFSGESCISNNKTAHTPIFCSGQRISGKIMVVVDDSSDSSFDAAEILFKGDLYYPGQCLILKLTLFP